ncbi:PaaI family thioesterase [Enterococcus camelliae]|uniref:PaaI family thioesterase n=1 Tax=Enterococcus camelliae TaxID=453959 RepID=A0ABW5TJB0_9ENTE
MDTLSYLGIKTEYEDQEKVELSLQLDERHLQPYGVMHGGISAILIETACSIGANCALGSTTHFVVGVDLTVSHLTPATTGKLTVTATPDRVGRSLQVWQATVVNEDGKKIAVGRCTLTVAQKTIN